jgi:hypothetical protein
MQDRNAGRDRSNRQVVRRRPGIPGDRPITAIRLRVRKARVGCARSRARCHTATSSSRNKRQCPKRMV